MKRTAVSGIVGMALFVAASAAFAADKTRSAEAFDRLSSLKGEWKGEIKGIDTTLIYTVTANSSALMEQCRPGKGPEMITMFTGDGYHLIATHYCSAKNQPQMATPAITDDWHNTGLTVIQEDNDHLTQEWSYQFKGKTGEDTFYFTRVRPGAT